MKIIELAGAAASVVANEVKAIRSALWFRPAAYCLLAASLALIVAAADDLLPERNLAWLPEVERDNLHNLLSLVAQGMLTVATVTLSVLMLVLNLAAGQASPRAVPEMMADSVTQNALGSFLATFVFALTALMLLGFGGITQSGVSLTFFCALALILNALRYIVQWIHHVAAAMKLNRIVSQVHRQAEEVLCAYLKKGDRERAAAPQRASGAAVTLRARQSGYVRVVDAEELASLAEEHGLVLRLAVMEGDFVHPLRPLMEVWGASFEDENGEDEVAAALRVAVAVGYERSPENDPLLGVELLTEIACRALSPGVNDPQTARVCLDHLGGLLAQAAARPPEAYPPACLEDGRVELRRVDFAALLERALRPVMRDGAGLAEVICRAVEVLGELAETADPAYLERLGEEAARAEAFGEAGLSLDQDRTLLGERAEAVRERIAARGA